MCGADLAVVEELVQFRGSSPRVRSRPLVQFVGEAFGGIISACAEQTRRTRCSVPRSRDHLRVCGADDHVRDDELVRRGSSPRVRSRLRHGARRRHPRRIISACAEQTRSLQGAGRRYRDHLRVCGADWFDRKRREDPLGSSPRVRSRRYLRLRIDAPGGIISACAEQTTAGDGDRETYPDHLRVCGADSDKQQRYRQHQGSSPRVRSRPWEGLNLPSNLRIISACAEQTPTPTPNKPNARDHLRVCGADSFRLVAPISLYGSSPRVRSRPADGVGTSDRGGIISACAEQTTCGVCRTARHWDHLRVCGADQTAPTNRLR